MRKLLFSIVVLANSALSASTVNYQLNCDSGMCSAGAGLAFADVQIDPWPGHSGSGFATAQYDFGFTVIAGPAQGFYSVCFSGGEDASDGSDSVAGSFLGQSAPIPTASASNFAVCGSPTSYTLNVPTTSTLFLSASASASASTPLPSYAFAHIAFTGFEFYDASHQQVEGVKYEFDVPAPEPRAALLVTGGLIALACARHFSAGRQSI